MRKYLSAVFLLLSAALMAQNPPAKAPGKASAAHSVVPAAQLKWTPMELPGCELAVVSGDPAKAGEAFTLRIKCVARTVIPAHWHPTTENVTMIKGTLLVGMGDKFDDSKLSTTLMAGDFISIPAQMRHFAKGSGETILQVHGTGPFAVNWVNPADVPKAPAKKSP